MNLSKAKEILNLYLQHSDQWNHQDLDTAIRLGIEAIKFTLAVRGTILNYATLPLPGETKD